MEAKRSYHQNGKKIKKGHSLNGNKTVLVKEKGYLILDLDHPRNLKITTGEYRLDSLINRVKIKYSRHQKWVAFLEARGLLNCKFAYKTLLVPGSNRHYEIDRVEVVNIDTSLGVNADLAIQWNNPDQNYRGKYLILLQEASSELFVDILETDESTISLDLRKYKLPYLTYSILAEDCRASRPQKIEVIM